MSPNVNRKAITRPAVLSLARACAALAHADSRADAVADWNGIALNAAVRWHRRRARWRADPLSWNPIVTGLIAFRALPADASARIHALTSIVAVEAHRVAAGAPGRCAPCILAASVANVLASELRAGGREQKTSDADRELGRAIARSALRQYYRPLVEP